MALHHPETKSQIHAMMCGHCELLVPLSPKPKRHAAKASRASVKLEIFELKATEKGLWLQGFRLLGIGVRSAF